MEKAMTAFPDRLRVFLALAAIVLITALVYLPGLQGGYVFDDFPNIVDNTALHVTRLSWSDWVAASLSSPSSALRRPLAMLTFAANYYFTGPDPAPMKFTNIAIHLLNTLLVFGLVRSLVSTTCRGEEDMTRRIGWTALAASAFWALHPINLMAVLYIVQRMESLCQVFVLAGLWAYVAGRAQQQQRAGGWWLVLGGLAGGTALGLLVKESAVLLPVYALCLELCIFKFRGSNQRRDSRVVAVFVAVLVVPAIIGMSWLAPVLFEHDSFVARNFTMTQRLLTEPRVLLDYLRWTVAPNLGEFGLAHDDFAVSHGLWDPPSTALAIFGLVALAGAAAIVRTRRPLVALGIFWFLCAHLLTATIIPLELVFEHRNYFASLGICIALADLLLLAPAARRPAQRAGAAIAVAFALLCATTTYLRATEWSNPLLFASTEAAKRPRSPRATYSLERALIVATNYQPSSPLIGPTLAAIGRARRVPNSGILPDQAALLFDAHLGRTIDPDLWADMQAKLRKDPIGPEEISALRSLTDCAIAHACMFDPNAMLATYWAAMSRGDNPDVLLVYGNYVLRLFGDDTLAMRLWKQASKLAPRASQYRISVIKLLIAQGHYDEARVDIADLRRLGGVGEHASEADTLESRLRDSVKAERATKP
jgi:hypothetical protein